MDGQGVTREYPAPVEALSTPRSSQPCSHCLLLLDGDRQGHPMPHKLQLHVVLHQFPELSFHCFWDWTLPDQHCSCTPSQARG